MDDGQVSRSNYLQIRLSDVEQANYKQLAQREGVAVAEWARNQLNWIVKRNNMSTNKEEFEPDMGERDVEGPYLDGDGFYYFEHNTTSYGPFDTEEEAEQEYDLLHNLVEISS